MKHEKLAGLFTKKILALLGIFQIISILALVSSPFVWVWHSWDLAWKIGVTSFLSVVSIGIAAYMIKSIVSSTIDDILKDEKIQTIRRSKFQERMEQYRKESHA